MTRSGKSIFSFFQGKVSTKIVGLAVVSIVVTTALLIGITLWQNNIFKGVATQQIDEFSLADLTHLTQSVYRLAQTQDDSITQQVSHNINVARYLLSQQGGIRLGQDTVVWKAVNQYGGKSQEVVLPKLLVGTEWLGQNADASQETRIVDLIKTMVGGTATIFQRMNSEGNLLRVATNVMKKDGSRAIGTYIPAVNPDGTPDPIVSAIVKGEAYHGLAYVVDAWYVAVYEPLYDQQGEVIGALYVGIKQENVDTMRQAITNIRIGKTGYIFVLGGQGDDQGQYIISKNGESDGVNIWESKDADGVYFIQNIIKEALQLKPGEQALVRYRWQNPGEAQPRWKVARIAYYQPWDWVIGVSAYEDEIYTYREAMDTTQRNSLYAIFIAAAGIILLGVIVANLMAHQITDPLVKIIDSIDQVVRSDIQQLVEGMKLLAEGDLTRSIEFQQTKVEVRSRDEIGKLAIVFNDMLSSLRQISEAYNQMTHNLRGLIGQIAENATSLILQRNVAHLGAE